MNHRSSKGEPFARRIESLLESWEPDPDENAPLRNQVKAHIKRYLGQDAQPHRIRSQRGSTVCDLIVNDTVAIGLYRNFPIGNVRQLRTELSSPQTSFDYLVIVGYNLPDSHADSWRLLETRYDPEKLGLDYVSFIRKKEPTNSTAVSALTIGRCTEPLLGLALLVFTLAMIEATTSYPNGIYLVITAVSIILTHFLLLIVFAVIRHDVS